MYINDEQLAHELTMEYMRAVCAKPAMLSRDYVAAYFERYNEILSEIQKQRPESDYGTQY